MRNILGVLAAILIVITAGISYMVAEYNADMKSYEFSEPVKITNESGGIAPFQYLLAYKNYVFAFYNALTWYEYQGLPFSNQTMTVVRSTDYGYTWNLSGVLSPTPYQNFTDQARAEIWNNTLYMAEFFIPNSKDYPCHILLYRTEDFGDSWEGPFNVTPPLWLSDLTPVDLAVWNNTVYVVGGWAPTATSYIQLYLMKSENGGRNFSSPIRLTDRQDNNIWPAIAVWENHVYIVWEGECPQGSDEALFIKSDDFGNNWSSITYITPTDGIHSWSHSTSGLVAYKNYVFFVYEDDPGDYPPHILYFRRSTDYGNTWEDPIVIYQTSPDKKFIYAQNILMDPVTKRLYISWIDNDTPNLRYVLRFVYSDDFGENWSQPINVTDYNIEGAGCNMISVYNNTIHAIYQRSGLGDLYYRRSPPFSIPEIPPEWIFITLFAFAIYLYNFQNKQKIY